MGLADQMHNMTDNFLHAQDFRTNRLKEIFEETNGDLKDTRKMMRGFHSERLENAKEVDKTLKDFTRQRLADAKADREQREKFTEAIAKETAQMLKQFRATHKAMSGQQRKELGHFVEDLQKQTSQMLNEFRKDHRQMAKALRQFLEEFMERFQKACADEQKQRQRFVGDNRKQTAEMTDSFHDERMKARNAWQQMTKAMAKMRREGAQKLAAAPRPRRPARQEKILALLKENRSGITLAELAYSMDMPSAAVAKTLQQMLGRKEIRKQEKLYLLKAE